MRIRSIKPEFWRSLDISAIEDWGDRLLFVGLWSYVDDNGVGLDRVSTIAADLFADDLERDPSETFARVSRGLRKLTELGRVARYTVDGRDYLFVNGWGKHQRIDHPNEPRYPLPSGEIAHPARENTTRTEKPKRSSRKPPENVGPGTEEQRNRGTEERPNGRNARAKQRPQPTFSEQIRGVPDPPQPDPPADNAVTPVARTDAAAIVREALPNGHGYQPATLTDLRFQVGELLSGGNDPEVVGEAVRIWHTHERKFPGLVSRLLGDAAVKLNPAAHPVEHRRSAGDDKVNGWLSVVTDVPQSISPTRELTP